MTDKQKKLTKFELFFTKPSLNNDKVQIFEEENVSKESGNASHHNDKPKGKKQKPKTAAQQFIGKISEEIQQKMITFLEDNKDRYRPQRQMCLFEDILIISTFKKYQNEMDSKEVKQKTIKQISQIIKKRDITILERINKKLKNLTFEELDQHLDSKQDFKFDGKKLVSKSKENGSNQKDKVTINSAPKKLDMPIENIPINTSEKQQQQKMQQQHQNNEQVIYEDKQSEKECKRQQKQFNSSSKKTKQQSTPNKDKEVQDIQMKQANKKLLKMVCNNQTYLQIIKNNPSEASNYVWTDEEDKLLFSFNFNRKAYEEEIFCLMRYKASQMILERMKFLSMIIDEKLNKDIESIKNKKNKLAEEKVQEKSEEMTEEKTQVKAEYKTEQKIQQRDQEEAKQQQLPMEIENLQ